jgi:DNA modification methylase
VRANECLSYKEARDPEDDRHVCPLQLDIARRTVELYTNKDEVVLSPFMGIGSEVYSAVELGRKGLGIELKESYFRQSAKNLDSLNVVTLEQPKLF